MISADEVMLRVSAETAYRQAIRGVAAKTSMLLRLMGVRFEEGTDIIIRVLREEADLLQKAKDEIKKEREVKK